MELTRKNNLDKISNETDSQLVSQDILSNSLKMYFREIESIPLLEPEEEKELLQRISQNDEEARNKLIKSNLRLVVDVARKFSGRGESLQDLIQAGNEGLIMAADRFDITKDNRFSTYAFWWIKNKIYEAISNKWGNINISRNDFEKIIEYRAAAIKLASALKREPTIDEIATEMGIPLSRAIELYNYQQNTISLNASIDGESEFGSIIPESGSSTEEIIFDGNYEIQVDKILAACNLKPRDIEIILMVFGLNGYVPMSLEKIGAVYSVTRQRIEQIKARVMRQIRTSDAVKSIIQYMKNPELAPEAIEFFGPIYQEESSEELSDIDEVGHAKSKVDDLHRLNQPK